MGGVFLNAGVREDVFKDIRQALANVAGKAASSVLAAQRNVL